MLVRIVGSDRRRQTCGIGVELVIFVILVVLVEFMDLSYLPSDISAIMWYLWFRCRICAIYILYNNSMWCIYCVIFDVWICEPCNCEKIGQKNDNFAECIYHSTRQRWLSQGPWDPDFPSVFALALGKDLNFAECQEKGTQQSWGVCWVPLARNMAMVRGMLSVVRQTLGKLLIFAECLSVSTRQSHR